MPKRKKADMTLAQRNADANDKFRNELRAQALEAVSAAPQNADIAKFRNDSYKDALRDAKQNA